MDQAELLTTLAPERQLALAYAPAPAKAAFLGLFALDTRIGSVVLSAREPMLAQIKLAWWREQLGKDPANRPLGEPVLAALSGWGAAGEGLLALVDGWEHLLGDDPVSADDITAFAVGRASACAALADLLGEGRNRDSAASAGHGWALAELAGWLIQPDAARAVRTAIGAHDWTRPQLSRKMRPLLVLHGMSVSARSRGLGNAGPKSLLVAMRLGLLGF